MTFQSLLTTRRWRVVNAPGDGHCFIYAVCLAWPQQLPHQHSIDHDQVKRMLLTEAYTNPELYLDFLEEQDQHTLFSDLHCYVTPKKFNGFYGDLIPVIFANAYKVNVTILNEFRDGSFREDTIDPTEGQGHRRGDHFNSVDLGIYPAREAYTSDRHKNCVYTSEFLTTLRPKAAKITRQVRKQLFYLRIWLPVRNTRPTQVTPPAEYVSCRPKVRVTKASRLTYPRRTGANLTNIIKISIPKWDLPRFINTNVRSIQKKIDDVSAVLTTNQIDVAAITESWLDDSIPSQAVSIGGYTLFRNDRHGKKGGGVVCYVKSNLITHYWAELLEDDIESLWLTIRSTKMPRTTPCITLAIIYHPPGAQDCVLTTHITRSIDKIRNKYPLTGIVLTGDFNHYKDGTIKRCLKLRQVVKAPTREKNILDKVYTNIANLYSDTNVLPNIGNSDHAAVLFVPKLPDNYRVPSKMKIKKRACGAN